MSYWLNDPDLFLYAKGIGSDDVHLWRCKKPVSSSSSSSSSLVLPMKPDDFDYVSNVENHLELIDDMFDWDETDYRRLVKYIFERRLLVNSQGFVIAELYKVDQDGNKMIDDANEEVPAIYIRSLDVLALKPYIPELRERPIPLRTVQVLEDVDGKAAVMEKDFNVTELTARVDFLEAENIRLESKNNTLDTNVAELTARVANLEAENTRLESKNNTLDTNVTENINCKEVWMNDNSQWVGFERLSEDTRVYDYVTVDKRGFLTDSVTTNVKWSYWCELTFHSPRYNPTYIAVCLEDLTTSKETARFSKDKFVLKKYQGKTYVLGSRRDSN